MSRTVCLLLTIGLVGASARADELRVTRVALFNSGVGFFECASTIEGTASVELKFRAQQINDVLKSLVLRDLDGGTISTVQYASRDPIEKALKSFGVDITGRPTLGELLDQLRGVPVEVQAPKPVAGLIMGVEKRTTKTEQGLIHRDVLTLLTDGGLRSFELASLAAVRITDRKIEDELHKALQTLAASHDAEKKSVVLNFLGEGRRRIRVGYLLETPIWKTSYRLVLDDQEKPYLQGWAIVENATEQDWQDVRLSLVSGRPISFIMDLYQPLYVPRPVEELDLYRSLRPPNFEADLGAPAEKLIERLELRRKAAAPRRRGGGLFGGSGGGFGGLGGGAGDAEAGMMDLDDAGVASVATAREAGELFEYRISTPVTLERQHSAMLPIITADIEGHKLSIYNPASHPKHPLNGLKIKNTTGLHLMQGPVTVFDDDMYAGDAKLPDLRVDEERLIAYALDLSTEVHVKARPRPEQVMKIWLLKGTVWQQRKYVDDRLYTVKNKSDAPRTVLIEQPVGQEWKLVLPEKPEERTANMLRFKLEVPAGETKMLPVRLERTGDEGIALTNLDHDRIVLYMRARVISEAVKNALARVVEMQSALATTRRQIEQHNQEAKTIATEQDRIRRNMQVLSKNSDVYRRYERKFDTQENRIEDLREEIAALVKQENEQRRALDEFLQSLDLR